MSVKPGTAIGFLMVDPKGETNVEGSIVFLKSGGTLNLEGGI